MTRRKHFSDKIPKAQETKAKIGKRDCIKIKSFCTTKGANCTVKRQHTKGEKIFENHTFDNELILRIYKKL
jgi:hypothetical protein